MLNSSRNPAAQTQFLDDFNHYDTARWPTVTNDGASGTIAVAVAAGSGGGWLNVPTAAAINDYQALSTSKVVEFLAGRPVRAEVRFKVTEAAANSAHLAFGLTDTLTTGCMVATTGAPLASYHGAMWYKPAGAAVFQTEAANATVKGTYLTGPAFVSGTTYTIGVTLDPGDGTTGTVTFQYQNMSTNAAFVAIPAQRVLLAGMTPMCLVVSVMASTNAVETLQVDYAGFEIAR